MEGPTTCRDRTHRGAYGSPDTSISNLKFLRHFHGLRRFSADALYGSLTTLDGLRHLPDDLTLGQTKARLDLTIIGRFKSLTRLYLEAQTNGLQAISELDHLEELTLRSITLPDLSPLTSLHRLRALELELGGTRDLRHLPEIGELVYLELWQIKGLNDITAIGAMTSLRSLFLQSLRQVTQLPDFTACTALRRIDHPARRQRRAGQRQEERRRRQAPQPPAGDTESLVALHLIGSNPHLNTTVSTRQPAQPTKWHDLRTRGRVDRLDLRRRAGRGGVLGTIGGLGAAVAKLSSCGVESLQHTAGDVRWALLLALGSVEDDAHTSQRRQGPLQNPLLLQHRSELGRRLGVRCGAIGERDGAGVTDPFAEPTGVDGCPHRGQRDGRLHRRQQDDTALGNDAFPVAEGQEGTANEVGADRNGVQRPPATPHPVDDPPSILGDGDVGDSPVGCRGAHQQTTEPGCCAEVVEAPGDEIGASHSRSLPASPTHDTARTDAQRWPLGSVDRPGRRVSGAARLA
jgi:hypothetical protein